MDPLDCSQQPPAKRQRLDITSTSSEGEPSRYPTPHTYELAPLSPPYPYNSNPPNPGALGFHTDPNSSWYNPPTQSWRPGPALDYHHNVSAWVSCNATNTIQYSYPAQPCRVSNGGGLNYQQPSVPLLIERTTTIGCLQDPTTLGAIILNPVIEQSELVCFGLVPDISGRCCCPKSFEGQSFSVDLNSSESFISKDSPAIRGRIDTEYGQMIQGLLDESTLELFVTCALEPLNTDQRAPHISAQSPCTLGITVYGPLELLEEIGSWFQEYDIFLQDPRVCHRDTKYCNPQRLSSEDPTSCPLVSSVVSHSTALINLHELVDWPDWLDVLSCEQQLEETPQPAALQAALHRHQKQALTFMIRRERGWTFGGTAPDIWEVLEHSTRTFFINRISETHQGNAPPQFHGGIIADPMGLGKTLTMIALIATDLGSMNIPQGMDEQDKPYVKATLIVIPQPLLGTWEQQLSEHVVHGALRYRRHHNKTRLMELQDFNDLDVVLTTYHTAAADWKTSKARGNHVLFDVRWRRIILDEAHVIRNGKSRMSRALCDLDAVSRWAVTGTPIQNTLGDLASLLKFIRAHPYNDTKRFEDDISRLWKSGEDEEAVKRLKRLSACLILRRSKGTINLPPRRDMKCPVDFNRAERALYDAIREQTITKLDEALLHDSEVSTSGVYVNFLQQIESMRLVCDLGLHYHTRHDQGSMQKTFDWASVAQQTFNSQREMGAIVCSQCHGTLELTDDFLDDSMSQDSPQFSRCLKFACAECSQNLSRSGHRLVCSHNPSCPVAPVSISNSQFEETSTQLRQRPTTSAVGLPSKVEALIADVKAQPPGVKSIVFSTWRLTLDAVEAGLNQASIPSVRFDGKVPQTQRQSVIDSFKKDPSISVILLTLSCGAVGLTLTEASRAYLMEPHWNPTIEEQALARIHRIGQKHEVTTIRFYIRDSFEERVMEVQESKKNLAGVLLSGHDGGQSDDSLGALQRLRSLL